MGFFTTSELEKEAKIEVPVDQLEPNCMHCGLNKNCQSPKMSIAGEGNKKILIISESPTHEEDEYGVPLIGDTGKLLSDNLREIGISLNKDCWKINAVNCAIQEYRLPTQKEIKYCFPYVEKAIRELKPKVILLLGTIAITSLMGDHFSDRSVNRWRGYQIPDERFGCFIIPMIHPSQVIRNENDKNLKCVFERDIKRIKSCLKREYIEQINYEKYVTVLKDFESVKRLLNRIIQRKTKIMFDYETTGLKPYRSGHKIVTIGLAVSSTKAFAFPYNYKSFWTEEEFKEIKILWKEILLNKDIKKMAHNYKFEDAWSRVRAGGRPKGWYWDPMMAEHCFPKEVEFLTSEGWKSCANVTIKDNVCQLDLQTKEITYKNPIKLINTETEELIHLKSKILNFCCTPNHDILHRIKKTGEVVKLSAHDAVTNRSEINFLGAGIYKGDTSKFTDIQLRLYAALLSDGFFHKKNEEVVGFGFVFKKERKIEYVIQLLNDIGINHKVNVRNSDKATVINIHNKNLGMELNELFPNKLLNFEFANSLNKNELLCFIQAFNFFDGAFTYSEKWPNSITIGQKEKQNIDVLQSMFCKIGYRVRGISRIRKTEYGKSKIFILTANKKDSFACQIKSAKVTRIKKKTKVYCVTTEKGTIITRYKGHVLVMGNCIDNRSKSTGLKFQTYVNYGVLPYDKHIAPFLKSKNGEFNTVEKAPFKELLIYNGLDCIYAWMRYEEQKHKFNGMKGLSRAYGFFMKGLYTMGTIQHNGICADMSYYKNTKQELTARISDLEKYLTSGRESKKFKEKFGRDIKITSNQDLGKLFYEVLGKPPIYTDASQKNYKTDKSTLESLNLPFVDKLAEMKRLEKAKGTYLGQFAREVVNGKMHPFFDLHIPVSYRSSSSMPNFQNIPKRDPEIGSLIRKGIVPSPGNVLCEADFSGAEVITSCCFHKDPNFKKYLIDPSTDMHRDVASDLWVLPDGMLNNPSYNDEQKKLAKMIRFFAKNNWTFAQFYGDWFGSCGPLLWENVIHAELKLPSGITVKEHLENMGIYELGEITKQGPTPGSFLEHCKEVEHKMWNERFPVYTQWKKDIVDFYQKYGYIETFFGFRFVGYMDRKQCCNFPIQGCLQGHSKVLTKKGWKRIDSLINKKVKVWTGFSWKDAVGVNRGKCKLATVHLLSGLTLDCDTRHEFKNDKNEWVKFKNLKIGDYVALPKIEKRIKSSKIDIDWYFILGFMTGDGWFGSKEITKFNTRYVLNIFGGESKYDILDGICNFLQKYHCKGFSKARILQKKQNVRTLHVEGRKLAETLQSFGYDCNKTAYTKSIPSSIWEGTRQQQQSFIDGLWLSDGSRKRKSLHMCNESLLKEVQVLLFGLGYDSFIRKTGDAWKLTPQNILHSTHTSRLYPKSTFDTLWNNNKLNTSPRNTYIVNKRNINSEKDFGQKTAERILNQKSEFVEIYRYDKVVKIDILDKEEETFTMSVNDSLHQFVADGIICKNTSFHLLVFTLIEVAKFIRKNKLRTKLIGQVHDSVIADVPKDEIQFYLSGVNKIVKNLYDRFDWLVVPMEIEAEISKTREEGGNFAEMKEVDPENVKLW